MLRLLWQFSKGYRLNPWRSPYLRWRMETYWGYHAESITARDFWRFTWQRRHDLVRFLRWADKNRERKAQPRRHFADSGVYFDVG